MSLSISVVIPCHTEDRWVDLQQSITSILQQTVPAKEIVVVVDHNPTLKAMVEETFGSEPQLVIIENQYERGLNGNRNTAIAATTSDIVAFIDDDAEAEPNWLEELLAGYTDETVAGVGGKINPQWMTARPDWFPVEFNWVVGCSYRGLPIEDAKVRNLIGCNMSYRREIIDALGGFTEGIGHVGGRPQGDDETEFCIRLGQQFPEKRLMFRPSAQVSHHVPAGRTTWAYYRWRCYLEGRSKANLARLVGAGDSTSSERAYTLVTLPSGVLLHLLDVFKGDLNGIRRAGAVIAGFTITATAYVMGRILQMVQRSDAQVQPDAAAAD